MHPTFLVDWFWLPATAPKAKEAIWASSSPRVVRVWIRLPNDRCAELQAPRTQLGGGGEEKEEIEKKEEVEKEEKQKEGEDLRQWLCAPSVKIHTGIFRF